MLYDIITQYTVSTMEMKMRTILLSMQPYWFEKVYSGEKIYEYRNKFSREEVCAYIYVSKPICEIKGVLYLGRREKLEDWKLKYIDNIKVMDRIKYYERGKNRYAMPINRVEQTNGIKIEDIKKEFPDFLIPQSYYYLDKLPILSFLQNKIKLIDIIENQFDDVDQICRLYREEDENGLGD